LREFRLRRLVVNRLKEQRQDPISVENPAYPGTPDVNYVGGWIELKSLDKWPKRKSTIVKIHHFKNEQRIWLRRRQKKGGRVHLLLSVGKEWLLFRGAVAADHVGLVDREKLQAFAVASWPAAPKSIELLAALEKDDETVKQ
jgi:hypothetical protein